MTPPSERAKSHSIALTWSEERILEYIRAGTLDAEIAVRLGLSVGEVKDRIAAMATKLGLSGRAELAAGPGAKADMARETGDDGMETAEPGSADSPERGRSRPSMVTLALLTLVLAGGAALAWLALTRESRPGPSPASEPGATEVPADTATPTARTPAPTFTPTPVMVGGRLATPLRIADETELPPGTALIIETGCWQCDGPAESLQRVYRQQDGTYHIDELFRPQWRSGASGEFVNFIHSYAISLDSSEIVVSVCTRPGCFWMDEGQASSEVTLYRSTDGGVTWREYARLAGSNAVQGILPDGLLVSKMVKDGEGQARFSFYRYPSGQAVESPVKGMYSWPVVSPAGRIVWQAEGMLVWGDGRPAVDFPLVAGSPTEAHWIDAGRYAVAWTGMRSYLAIVQDGLLASVHTLPSPYTRVGAAIHPWELVGNTTLPGQDAYEAYRPVLISLAEGTIRPLRGRFGGQQFDGRGPVAGVQVGPFLRVTTPGDCLNIRAEPSTSAAVLDCAADRVLLKDLGQRTGTGEVWARVRTPAGIEGWARGWKPGEVYLVP